MLCYFCQNTTWSCQVTILKPISCTNSPIHQQVHRYKVNANQTNKIYPPGNHHIPTDIRRSEPRDSLAHYAPTMCGVGEGPDQRGLLYATLPCISARGCFHGSNPWPPGHMAVTFLVTLRLPFIHRSEPIIKNVILIFKNFNYIMCPFINLIPRDYKQISDEKKHNQQSISTPLPNSNNLWISQKYFSLKH